MKFNSAIITSLNGAFEKYELKNIVSITWVGGVISLTYIDKTDNTLNTVKYDSNYILINIA